MVLSFAERFEIEWSCQKLVERMGRDLDEGRIEAFANGFTQDGEWTRRGETLSGRAMIMSETLKRSPTLRLRHVFTNFIVDIHDANTVHCTCYMNGFRNDPGEGATDPVFMKGRALWLYHDDMVRTEEGWRVKKRWSERLFEDVRPGPE